MLTKIGAALLFLIAYPFVKRALEAVVFDVSLLKA